MDIVIIGGIAAGMSVAAKARREDPNATITVIEKEDYISFGACGLPYYIGEQFEDETEMFARTPEQIESSGIKLYLRHEVLDIEIQEKKLSVLNLDDNNRFEIAYDRLMIATGARAVKPKIKGIDSTNVFTITRLNEVNDLKNQLKDIKNIVIVGGGFIGVEVAEQLHKFNKNITLLHSRSSLMNAVFDPEFGDKIQESLEDLGVSVILNQRAESFTTENRKVSFVHSANESYPADLVILATGFKPNTEFLNGQLKTLDNGAIIIDEFGRTSEKDIFAAGDCATINDRIKGTNYIPLATYANKMGRIIGVNIVSEYEQYLAFNGALSSSAILAGNVEAGSTGLNEQEAKELGINFKTTTVNANNHSNYYPNQDLIMIKLIYDAETYVLLGAQVLGKSEAVLRLQALTTAIYAGLTTKDLGFMDFAYAPPFASTWEALNIAANTAK